MQYWRQRMNIWWLLLLLIFISFAFFFPPTFSLWRDLTPTSCQPKWRWLEAAPRLGTHPPPIISPPPMGSSPVAIATERRLTGACCCLIWQTCSCLTDWFLQQVNYQQPGNESLCVCKEPVTLKSYVPVFSFEIILIENNSSPTKNVSKNDT